MKLGFREKLGDSRFMSTFGKEFSPNGLKIGGVQFGLSLIKHVARLFGLEVAMKYRINCFIYYDDKTLNGSFD
jgi:hypothetical protein